MNRDPFEIVLDHVRAVADTGPPDAELLEMFAVLGEEMAFSLLLRVMAPWYGVSAAGFSAIRTTPKTLSRPPSSSWHARQGPVPQAIFGRQLAARRCFASVLATPQAHCPPKSGTDR